MEKKNLLNNQKIKILVIGAVNSSAKIIECLLKHKMTVVGILGYEPKNKNTVSGWFNLQNLANKLNINYKRFNKINDNSNLEWAERLKPDIIFAVGFSQLLSVLWINMPSLGVVGFHPTLLPSGRGRAPLAWLVLEEERGSATFFLMGTGADDGPIFVQKIFHITQSDDASSVEKKILSSIELALDEWLPKLKKGIWDPVPQDELKATWYGKRNPEDGHIDWSNSAYQIDRLIKASSKPHPGAYTYLKNHKVTIWESQLELDLQIKGVIGRILLKDTRKGYLIQAGNGLIWINNLETSEEINFKIGHKLGYNVEDEIFKIWKIISSQN